MSMDETHNTQVVGDQEYNGEPAFSQKRLGVFAETRAVAPVFPGDMCPNRPTDLVS